MDAPSVSVSVASSLSLWLREQGVPSAAERLRIVLADDQAHLSYWHAGERIKVTVPLRLAVAVPAPARKKVASARRR